MIEIRVLAAARAELLAARDHYDSEAPGLGAELIDEVEDALRRLADFPSYGSPHLSGTRRIVLNRFPFDLVYRLDRRGPLVVAVAHHKRSPGYWSSRL